MAKVTLMSFDATIVFNKLQKEVIGIKYFSLDSYSALEKVGFYIHLKDQIQKSTYEEDIASMLQTLNQLYEFPLMK